MTQPNKVKDQGQKCKEPSGSKGDFLDAPLTDKIGSCLKSMYDDVVNEPIPDDFLALLAKADEA